jgi:invasion protein IalB
MVWSGVRSNMVSRCAARVTLCASVGALALALAMPAALAQQVQPKSSSQAPKTQPSAPAPTGVTPVAPAVGAAPAAGAFGDAAAGGVPDDAWVKLCMKSEQTQNKEICLINHEGLEPNTGMVLIAAAVRKVEGEDKQQLLVRVPTAYALVIPAGVQIKIDEGQPIQLQYTICFPTSCQVQLELTKEMFENLRKGKQMVVAAMNIQQKTMGFPVPLTSFAKAYDGPPVDSAKYEESRRKLMEMFRKRQADLAAKAQEAQQKKEAQQTPPAGGGAPAAGATAAQKKPTTPAPATP